MAVRDTITVRFPLLGLELSTASGGILNYHLDSDYMTSTDGWSLDVFSTDGVQYGSLFELQPVEILINDTPQVIGRVDVTEIGSADGSVMHIEGRDYLADLVECHVDPSLKIAKDMTLSAALLLACGPVGIDKIVDDADVNMRSIHAGVPINGPAGRAFKEIEVGNIKAEPGQGMFDWCNRLVARQGATIQPGIDRRQLVLSAPNYRQDPSMRVVRRPFNPAAHNTNVIHARARSDYSSFPTFVLAVGKVPAGSVTLPAAIASELDDDDSVDVDAGKVDPEDLTKFSARFPDGFSRTDLIHSGRIKPGEPAKPGASLYRMHHIRDDDSRSVAELARVRLRHAAERLKDTLSYEVELVGHSDPKTGAVYAVDTVIDVDDTICNVRERLWVAARTFEYSESSGPTTRLRCIRLGSFVI
jgi:hypothetical protein